MDTIRFYSLSGHYGQFSNCATYPINLEGKKWPTSEYYFQAQKFEDLTHQRQVRTAKTPMEAAKKGRDRRKKLRSDWESVKDSVMKKLFQRSSPNIEN